MWKRNFGVVSINTGLWKTYPKSASRAVLPSPGFLVASRHLKGTVMSPDCQHSKVIFYSDQRTPASRRNSPSTTKHSTWMTELRSLTFGANFHRSEGDCFNSRVPIDHVQLHKQAGASYGNSAMSSAQKQCVCFRIVQSISYALQKIFKHIADG